MGIDKKKFEQQSHPSKLKKIPKKKSLLFIRITRHLNNFQNKKVIMNISYYNEYYNKGFIIMNISYFNFTFFFPSWE